MVDGENDGGVDIFYRDDDRALINIGNCKVVSKFSKSSENFPGSEVDKVLCFLDEFLRGDANLLRRVNAKLALEVRLAWDAMEERTFEVAIHLFSNKMPLALHEQKRVISAIAHHRSSVSLNEHGLYELAHGAVRNARPTFRKKLRPVRSYDASIDAARGFQMEVELSEMARFLDIGDQKSAFDERLLTANVRYFLGHDNIVNREIARTISDSAKEFWYRNNGITIVCDQIVGHPINGHHFTLVNPNIVNGGQTANVIHKILNESLISNIEGSVSVKLVETKNRELIDRIALSSNTQTRILGRDLRANDPIQEKLQRALASYGYFYRRKNGEISPNKALKQIDALRAGQILLSYVAGEPARSKTNSNELFEDLYNLAFGDSPCPETIIAGFELNREIENRRAFAVAGLSAKGSSSFEETWIIEGHFHIVFVVGEMLRRQCLPLSDTRLALGCLDGAMAVVERYSKLNAGISGYRLFRSAQSKAALMKLIGESAELDDVPGVQSSFDFLRDEKS